eukprot:5444325-Pyramimonas_sp.AAC.2
MFSSRSRRRSAGSAPAGAPPVRPPTFPLASSSARSLRMVNCVSTSGCKSARLHTRRRCLASMG